MADETYDFDRKLKYTNRVYDNGFTVKYTIDPDSITQNAQLPPKQVQSPQTSYQQKPIQQIEKEVNIKQQYEKKKPDITQTFSKPNTNEFENKNGNKNEKRNKRAQKMLEFKKQEAQIFKNFNKFNTKKMKGRKNSDDLIYEKTNFNKKNKNRKEKDKNNVYQRNEKKRKIKNMSSESQQQLGSMYHYFNAHQNMTKRSSQSTEKIQIKQRDFTNIPTHFESDNQPAHTKKNKIYPSYLSLEDILDSREDNQNKYFKGTVDFTQKVKNYARIFSKEVEGDLIAEGVNKNRCIHGDEVYFELLANNELPDRQKDTMNEKIRCKIVFILPWKANEKRKIVGKIEFTRKKNTFYLVPINKRLVSFDIKFSDISKQEIKKKEQKYFLAEFTQWKQTDEFPGCRLLSQFGEIGDIETETSALLISNGVDDKEYDEQTIQKGLQKFLKCTDSSGEYKIDQSQILKRADLRNQRIFTIDPLTARDFDDALSATCCGTNEKGEKIYEIGVHIADASFFVEEGGLIDEKAQKTTTSVYLVHRVLPMLPRVLCETMCSLNPGLERLTLSVWFKLTENGELLPGCRYDRSVIKSKARFTYQQAQQIIQNEIESQKDIQSGFGCVKEDDFEAIANDILVMNSIAVKIRQGRIKGGSLIFQTPKKTFKLDQNFYPESFTVGKRVQAHCLVEEYMLLANQKVGEILVENVRESALLRRHRFPTEKKIERFQQFSQKVNQPIKIERNTPMQEQMNAIIKNPKVKQCIKDVLNYQMIFLLEQAQYFIVENTPEEEWIHYALNMPVYTHFTSPIRRYPDIIVHRQLIAIINQKKNNSQHVSIPNYEQLKELVERCNKNKTNAKKVSSGCQKIFLCLYLKTHPVFCKAVLTDLNQYCLTICVPSYDFRSVIELKQLKKAKPLLFSKDSSQRKYVQIELEYEAGQKTKIILKEMQEVDIKLTAKEGFPIDYMIRLIFPHPKDLKQRIVCD